jgi:hypothetical protein
MLLQNIMALHVEALVWFSELITKKSNDVSYEIRAITVRSNSDFYKP